MEAERVQTRAADKKWVLVPRLIRAWVGHTFPFIDAERIAVRLKEEHQSLFSTLCHRTRLDRLEGIFENGLLSGEASGISGRTMAFLSGFVSGDMRNLAAGRQEEQHDAEIIFDDRAVFAACESGSA